MGCWPPTPASILNQKSPALGIPSLRFKPTEPCSRPSSERTSRPSLINIDIPASFNGRNRVTKLVIAESGTTAESGFILTASDGTEIVIVSGVYPYSLAMKGVGSVPHGFEPEYDLE